MPTPCLLVRPGMRMNGSDIMRRSGSNALRSFQRRRLPGVPVDLVRAAERIEQGLGDAATANLADLGPDAINNDHVAAAQWDFPPMVEPIVERRRGGQVGIELGAAQHFAKLSERHAAPDDKLVSSRIDVP